MAPKHLVDVPCSHLRRQGAQTAPLSQAAEAATHGPDPTEGSVTAPTGPFQVGQKSVSRVSVQGFGGGTLEAARDNQNLKAAIPMTPWDLTKNFSTDKVPTLIIGGQADTIAPVAQHAKPFYCPPQQDSTISDYESTCPY